MRFDVDAPCTIITVALHQVLHGVELIDNAHEHQKIRLVAFVCDQSKACIIIWINAHQLSCFGESWIDILTIPRRTKPV